MKKITPYILVAPMAVLVFVLLLGVFNALLQSLGYIPALDLQGITFDYYKEILQSPDFIQSLLLSLRISVLSTIGSVGAGVLLCAAIIYTGKNSGIWSYLVRLPILTPHTVVALYVIMMFSQSGILSRLFYFLGFASAPADFPNLVYSEGGYGIILAYVWKQAPFVAYFMMPLMESISKTLEEAAANLGASPIRAFFHVTLPLSMPAIANAAFIIFAFSFGAYELPFLLGVTKPKALPVQAYIEYTHPDLRHRPYAMAANGILIFVVLLAAVCYFVTTQRKQGRG